MLTERYASPHSIRIGLNAQIEEKKGSYALHHSNLSFSREGNTSSLATLLGVYRSVDTYSWLAFFVILAVHRFVFSNH